MVKAALREGLKDLPGLRIVRLPASLRRAQWTALLKGWARLIEDYSVPDKDGKLDVAYWYGERALTGLLAAAAWQLRSGWSLEEFTGRRGKRQRKKTAARGDLWLGTGLAEYAIEAKIVWAASSRKVAIRQAEKQLGAATHQLKTLDRDFRKAMTGVALCYVVPDLRVGGRHASEANIQDLFTEVPTELSGSCALAATYLHEGQAPQHDGRLYPGVILVGRVLG